MMPGLGPAEELVAAEGHQRRPPPPASGGRPARTPATPAGRRPARGRRRRAGRSRGRTTTGGPRAASSPTSTAAVKPVDPEVGRVDLQHDGHVGARPGDGAAVVGQRGCGWWCPRRRDGRPTGPSPRAPGSRRRSPRSRRATPPPRGRRPAPPARAARRRRCCSRPSRPRRRTAGRRAGPRRPGGSRAARSRGRARGWRSRRPGAVPSGARPRLVWSRTPVAFTTRPSRARRMATARARAESGAPAAIASRAASTRSGRRQADVGQRPGQGVDRRRRHRPIIAEACGRLDGGTREPVSPAPGRSGPADG